MRVRLEELESSTRLNFHSIPAIEGQIQTRLDCIEYSAPLCTQETHRLDQEQEEQPQGCHHSNEEYAEQIHHEERLQAHDRKFPTPGGTTHARQHQRMQAISSHYSETQFRPVYRNVENVSRYGSDSPSDNDYNEQSYVTFQENSSLSTKINPDHGQTGLGPKTAESKQYEIYML